MQTRSQMTAGNMPGGGKGKTSMSAVSMKWKPAPSKPKLTADKLYTTKSAAEKGKINSKKVAALKAKPGRPKPLKRTSKIKLDKASLKALKEQRVAAKAKYEERSALVKKELVYKKNSLKRQKKKVKTLSKKQPKSEPNFPNILSMMYKVGPQPKYTHISKKFREYRKFAKAQLKHSKASKQNYVSSKADPVACALEISYLYKVGEPVKPVPSK